MELEIVWSIWESLRDEFYGFGNFDLWDLLGESDNLVLLWLIMQINWLKIMFNYKGIKTIIE